MSTHTIISSLTPAQHRELREHSKAGNHGIPYDYLTQPLLKLKKHGLIRAEAGSTYVTEAGIRLLASA